MACRASHRGRGAPSMHAPARGRSAACVPRHRNRVDHSTTTALSCSFLAWWQAKAAAEHEHAHEHEHEHEHHHAKDCDFGRSRAARRRLDTDFWPAIRRGRRPSGDPSARWLSALAGSWVVPARRQPPPRSRLSRMLRRTLQGPQIRGASRVSAPSVE